MRTLNSWQPTTRPRRLATRTLAAVGGIVALSGALMVSPAGAATQSTGTMITAETSPYGTVLAVGSGQFTGYTVYAFSRNSAAGCSTKLVTTAGQGPLSCAGSDTDKTADWPIVSTVGKPIAGPGVKKRLLGMVYRKDIKEDQVTYAGKLLYLFDMKADQFTGVNFLETAAPLPPWRGVWSAVLASEGLPATGPMTLTTQTQPNGSTVLDVDMFQGVGTTAIVAYESKHDTKGHSNCTGACALVWMPIVTSAGISVSPGLEQKNVSIIARADGTRQVAYKGHPLYLYDAEVPHLDPSTGNPLNPATTGSGNGIGGFTLVTISSTSTTTTSSTIAG